MSTQPASLVTSKSGDEKDWRSFSVWLPGKEQAKGSARAFTDKAGRAYVTSANSNLKKWAQGATKIAKEAYGCRETMQCPVAVTIEVFRQKPQKPKYRWPGTKPDLDKVVRAVCDVLTTAGVYKDDALICYVQAQKTYCDDDPGIWVTVEEVL